MSHEIEYNKERGTHSFATAKKAWHELGKVYGRKMTSTEALHGANLDFTVEKEKNHIFLDDQVVESNSYSTYRTDTKKVLGTVGKDYTIVQNQEGFDFIDILAGKSNGMVIDSAGSLRDGSTVFITAKLPSYINLFGEDLTEMYVVFTNNHTGVGSVTALITPVRVVCNNTLAFSMRNNQRKVSMRHTKNVHEKIRMADVVMERTSKYTKESEELFLKLAKAQITDEQAYDYLSEFHFDNKSHEIVKEHNFNVDIIEDFSTRKKNTFNELKRYYHEGIGQTMKSTEGTAFGLYNAITGFSQNVKSYKSNDIKMENILDGIDFKKQNTFVHKLAKDFVY